MESEIFQMYVLLCPIQENISNKNSATVNNGNYLTEMFKGKKW